MPRGTITLTMHDATSDKAVEREIDLVNLKRADGHIETNTSIQRLMLQAWINDYGNEHHTYWLLNHVKGKPHVEADLQLIGWSISTDSAPVKRPLTEEQRQKQVDMLVVILGRVRAAQTYAKVARDEDAEDAMRDAKEGLTQLLNK